MDAAHLRPCLFAVTFERTHAPLTGAGPTDVNLPAWVGLSRRIRLNERFPSLAKNYNSLPP